ncbi:MAG: hypothetical protein QHH30_06525 [candidate division NC10 bacterium]|nr:hypothetical protein [candidate division NC10 bacterium]
MERICEGLEEFKKNREYWNFTEELERRGEGVVQLLQKHGDSPPSREVMREAKAFLSEVERWKGMSMQDQVKLAKSNPEAAIWRAFQRAMYARTDLEEVRSIMSLVGFGSSPHPETRLRRAKRATAVLRFLKPKDWGAVDWRTIELLRLLDKHSFDVEAALDEAKSENPRKLKRDLDHINEDWACEINRRYRAMRSPELPRAADVEMALFGFSLLAWPLS